MERETWNDITYFKKGDVYHFNFEFFIRFTEDTDIIAEDRCLDFLSKLVGSLVQSYFKICAGDSCFMESVLYGKDS